jgi:hypothetical protein
MKRLIADNEKLDNVFALFKDIVTVDSIVDKLIFVYASWDDAAEDNQQIDVDDSYGRLNDWFDLYYESVVTDCIRDAKDDFSFNEKYNEMSIDEQDDFERRLSDYIYDIKDEIIELMNDKEEENR